MGRHVSLTVLLLMALAAACAEDPEPGDWTAAETRDTVESYQEYLQRHPQGPHAGAASERHATKLEERAWATASEAGSIESLEGFLAEFPSTHRKDEIATALEPLREEREWKAAWPDNLEALRAFASRHPSSPRTKLARRTLVCHALKADVAALLAKMGTGKLGGRGIPGSRYFLGTEVAFLEGWPVKLPTFGACTFDGVAQKGGTYHVLEDGTLCLFGNVKLSVKKSAGVVLTLFVKVSDGSTVLSPDSFPLATAVVDGLGYVRVAEDSDWTME